MKTTTKLWIAAVVGLLVVVGLLAGIKAGQFGAMMKAGKAFVPPPESVTSARVEATRWQAARAAIGTLVAVRAVNLSTEIAGTVREIGFESGAHVKQGQVLVKLDTSAEEAQLAAAIADAALAKTNLERAHLLAQGGANTKADLDAADARAKATDAAVANLRATIAKKTLRAPFDGRIAIRQVELGQVVGVGAPIGSLQSVTPMYADFWLPQQALADVKVGQQVRMKTDIYPGSTWDGAVSVINPEVDPSTRNVRIRAAFSNADGRLKPGMFVNVEVRSAEQREVVVIPATAVLYAPYGDSVFVLEEAKGPDGKPSTVAKQRFVRLGDRRGDFVAVTEGVRSGERIVSTGAFKLRNGMAVVVNDALAPEAGLAPKPVEQ